MKKFLYLCLFGTALAGGVNIAKADLTGRINTWWNNGASGTVASEIVESGKTNLLNTGRTYSGSILPNGQKLNGEYKIYQGNGVTRLTSVTNPNETHTIFNNGAVYSKLPNGNSYHSGSYGVKAFDSSGKLIAETDVTGDRINGLVASATKPNSPVSNPTAATPTLDSYVETGLDEENIFREQFGEDVTSQVKTPQLRSGPQSGFEGEYEFAGYDANGMPVDRYGNILPGDGTDYELPMQNSNVAPKTTPASGANTPAPDAGFDAEAVYGKYNKDMMDHLESQWNGTLPKVLPDSALDMGFIKQAGINEFIPNADGTVDLKMGSDWFGSSLTMDTKDFNAIFGKGGELPIQETNLGGGQSVLFLPNGSVLKEAQNGLLTDGKGNFFLESGGNAYPVDPNMSPAELQTVANQAKAKEALKAALKPSDIDKANVTNAFEYALQILEAVEGINQDDATKETTVKGVQSLQNSQGGSSDYSMGTDVSLEATTIASAAELMVELLRNNPMNLTYLDETKCAEYKEDTSTRRECLQEMKKISANATALSGVMIAEGSNAISSKFYDRIKNFTDINNNLGTGSLGAMSVINDAERYPYFEMVRGTALSAVQLGVKEMGTLTELDDLAKEAENAQ